MVDILLVGIYGALRERLFVAKRRRNIVRELGDPEAVSESVEHRLEGRPLRGTAIGIVSPIDR